MYVRVRVYARVYAEGAKSLKQMAVARDVKGVALVDVENKEAVRTL